MPLADKRDDVAPYFSVDPGARLGAATVSGSLAVIGLGPGSPQTLTPEAAAALASRRRALRLRPLSRPRAVACRPDPPRLRQPRGGRARRGGAAPRRGRRACRAGVGRRSRRVRHGGGGLRADRARRRRLAQLDVSVVPGVTAMLAVAARVGAPLGHDFCAISLSDNLKPWELIERRLDAAAGAGFVIALYNPISRARPWQLGKAFERLRRHLPASTPVIFGRAVGRADEKIRSRRSTPPIRHRPTWRR